MSRIIADLHIHSRYSRATSSRLTPPCLDRWARIKGIDLLGTGDCTHPVWLTELRDQLEDAEEGFYTLKKRVKQEFDGSIALTDGLPNPPFSALDGKDGDPRFVLTGEISTVYSRNGRTRKVHHLIILPGFEAAEAFKTRLERVGNIVSDGRPILGIDSRDLLAMLLDTDDRAMLVPAHIWTPWFSALGARSGFDSLDECYRDLAHHIHALETGLSSNPPMNWAVKSLDRFGIISNSDAHSPDKLGREATIFDMRMSYSSLAAALDGNQPDGEAAITETLEFFPQEGKYHYDGHRGCGVVLSPEESVRFEGICPVCKKPLTQGVMRRVLELAARPVDEAAACPQQYAGTNKRPYRSLIPLRELIGELLETGAASKKAGEAYGFLVEKTGGEFSLLMDMKSEEIESLRCPGLSGELLAVAVRRMRSGEVSITPGYDGEYGVIRAFPPGEKPGELKGADLFGDIPGCGGIRSSRAGRRKTGSAQAEIKIPAEKQRQPENFAGGKKIFKPGDQEQTSAPAVPDPDQEKAVFHAGGHAIIIAGPGTGKTFLLASRIAWLVKNGADPASILAVTFTVKAASELGERIAKTTGPGGITATTFHAFCASLLREHACAVGIPENFEILDESGQEEILKEIVNAVQGKIHFQTAGKYIEERKRFLLLPGQTVPEFPLGVLDDLNAPTGEIGQPNPRLESVYREYRRRLKTISALDFDDLVAGAVRLLAKHGEILSLYRKRFRFIFVDEYQDVNFGQYALIRLLAPNAGSGQESGGPELCVIGDPHQAIYGFRGADKCYIDRFLADYPGAAAYRLNKSFRCAAPIINAAGRLMDAQLEGRDIRVSLYRSGFPTEKAEAEGIARRISRLIGGTSFFAFDSGIVRGSDTSGVEEGALKSLGECAILLRAVALSPPIEKALRDHGIPFHLIGEKPWREEESIHVDAVSILTIHASKGLEFDHVFVAGIEEGLLPFTLYDEKNGGNENARRIDEERRLLYVAMTRARSGLYLSWARSRIFQGRKLERGPSRFLGELENLVPQFQDTLPKREKDPQLRLF